MGLNAHLLVLDLVGAHLVVEEELLEKRVLLDEFVDRALAPGVSLVESLQLVDEHGVSKG